MFEKKIRNIFRNACHWNLSKKMSPVLIKKNQETIVSDSLIDEVKTGLIEAGDQLKCKFYGVI